MAEPIRKESPSGLQQPTQQEPQHLPLLNYTLSTVCPACQSPTYRAACKVRCSRCGFTWDCSEL